MKNEKNKIMEKLWIVYAEAMYHSQTDIALECLKEINRIRKCRRENKGL